MTFNTSMLTLAATIAAVLAAPAPVVAQQRGMQAQRSENVRATTSLRARIDATEARIATAQRSRAVTANRAASLRRQVAQTRASMMRLSRRQGFVSAAELASYNRTLGAIDATLDDRGVPRGYGNDMLAGPGGGNEKRRFNCQNDPIDIAIPGDRLEDALDRLSRTTQCPISGTALSRGKRSRPVVGRMTPMQALQAMLDGTGLQVQEIRQGFQVIPLPRR